MEQEKKLIGTQRMDIVEATAEDITTIIEIESHKDNRDFLWIGTWEEHKAEIADPNQLLLLFRTKEDGRIVGYALARIHPKADVFELRRIAITEKGMGFGKESIQSIMHYAFTTLGANRLWLDVYSDNLVGIRLYESLGMHRDGVLRQNDKADRGYLDQIIYSMLKSEYLTGLE